MSYDHNIYVGWYAEFTPTSEKRQVGVEKIFVCSANHSHKSGKGNFCSVCGQKKINIEKPVLKTMAPAHHMQHDTDPEELDYMTIGRASKEELDIIFEGHAPIPTSKTIIMSKYSYCMSDVAREGACVLEIEPYDEEAMQQWHDIWKKTIIKVFGCTDFALKYGIVHEII